MTYTRLAELLTPKEALLNPSQEFCMITPDVIKDRFHLLSLREEIRNLRLVPVKDPETYARYHSFSKIDLLKPIIDRLDQIDHYFDENMFPYYLPRGIAQNILWLREGISDSRLYSILTEILDKFDLSNVIIFERPVGVNIKYVRGSVSEIRHLHIWIVDAQLIQ